MIEITIPRKTPSINHLYGRRGFRSYIKPEGKELKEYIITLVKHYPHDSIPEIPNISGQKLSIQVDIYENWFTKEGRVARKDISNREKFLIDSVFEGLELDDKFIFEHTMRKIQSDEEKAIIRISTIE